jgi:hypothetical protein
MTLRTAEPSREAIETVRAHLSDLAARPQFQHRLLGGAEPTQVALAAPHDVYAIGLDRLAEGAWLDAADVVGQRFLVLDDEQAVASAELAAGGGFESNEGPFVGATAEAIRAAEASPDLVDGNYELRLLRIPGVYLMALWLRDEDGEGDGDVVVPLAPAPLPLEAGRHYAPAQLQPILRELAQERLAISDVD